MIDAHMPKRHFDNAPTTAQVSKIFCSAGAAAMMSCLCFDFGLLSLAIYWASALSRLRHLFGCKKKMERYE